MTHELCLPYDLHTALDLVATVIYVLEGCCDHVHVIVGIYTACDAEAEEVKASETVLAGYRIAVCENVTDFTTTYTGLDIEFDCKCLCRELFLRNVCKHSVCVYEEGMSTCRTLVWNTVLIKLGCEVLYLADTCLYGLKLSVLITGTGRSGG